MQERYENYRLSNALILTVYSSQNAETLIKFAKFNLINVIASISTLEWLLLDIRGENYQGRLIILTSSFISTS